MGPEKVKIELLINPFCLCARGFGVLSKICKEQNVTFDSYSMWDIDDKDLDRLPEYISSLIREWRTGQRAGSVYSNVFINGERTPINNWPKSFQIIEKKIAALRGEQK